MSELTDKPTTPATSITEAMKRKPLRADEWIQTFTGRAFYPLAPRDDDVCIDDIAHALSMKCRFNGHCREFWSVAQHSLCVEGLLQSHGPSLRMEALLHDAAEAYLPDVCRPIKGRLFFGSRDDGDIDCDSFKDAEGQVLRAICRRFHLRWPFPADWSDIKYADDIMLATEAALIMAPPPFAWEKLPPPQPAAMDGLRGLAPAAIRTRFLQKFYQLSSAMKDER